MAGRHLAYVAVFSALLTSNAYAGEYGYPSFQWTGFYVGVNGGYGWGESKNNLDTFAPLPPEFQFPGSNDCDVAAVCISSRGTNDLKGVIGGLQAGYNWQAGRFVVGIETDFQASDQDGTQRFTTDLVANTVPITASGRLKQELSWLGTLRGRVGVVARERWQ